MNRFPCAVLAGIALSAAAGCRAPTETADAGGPDAGADSGADAGADAGTDADTDPCWADNMEEDGAIWIADSIVLADGSSVHAIGASPMGGYDHGSIRKYGAAGDVEWEEDISSSWLASSALARHGDDGFVVGGGFGHSLNLGDGFEFDASPDAVSGYLARLDLDGHPEWVVQIDADDVAVVFGLAALADGSVVATGQLAGSAVFGEGTDAETLFTSDCADPYYSGFAARFLADGSFAWVVPFCGRPSGSVAVRADDSVTIVGFFADEAVFGAGSGSETALVTTGGDFFRGSFAATYGADGDPLWAGKGAEINFFPDRISATALADGALIVSGNYAGAAVFATAAGPVTLYSAPHEGYPPYAGSTYLSKWSAEGEQLWVQGAGCAGGEKACAVATSVPYLLPGNELFFTCGYRGAVRFGDGDSEEAVLDDPSGMWSACTARYDADGNLLALASIGSGWDGFAPGAVHVFPSGDFLHTSDAAGSGALLVEEELQSFELWDSNVLVVRTCP